MLLLLAIVNDCINPSSTAWLLTEKHYNRIANIAFQWDEWESLSIEAASEEDDQEWTNRIRLFWSFHLPIMMSIKNGYSYAAVSLSLGEYGAVVVGSEPEFEETETVSASVMEFLIALGQNTLTSTGGSTLQRFI